MSTVKSSNEHLTFNADGTAKNILFQSNGTQKASISSAGLFTSSTIDATVLTGNLPALNGSALTNLPDQSTDISGKLSLSGGAMTGAITTNSTFDGRDVAADGVLATNALPKAGGVMTGALKGVAGSASAASFAFSSNLNTGIGFVANKGLFLTAMGTNVLQAEKLNNNPHIGIGRQTNYSDNANVVSIDLGGSSSIHAGNNVGEFSGIISQANSRYTDSGDLAIATGRVTRASQYYGSQYFDWSSASAGAAITWNRSLTLPYGGGCTIGNTTTNDPVLLIQSGSGGDPQLRFSSNGANRGAAIKFLDNGSAVGGFINYTHSGNRMEFGAGSSTGITFRVCDGYSNATTGLTFGSDTAAANRLDDYEEGTFTMAVQDWSDATFSIASVTAAKYTKVGNAVTIWFRGSLVSSTSNPSEGDIKFTGWPFSTAGGVQIYVDFIAANLGTNQTNMRLSFYGNGAYLYCLNSSGNLTSMSASLPGTTEFGLSFTYMTA